MTCSGWVLCHRPINPPVPQAIRSLRPWTMSWSNLPDYLDPRDFHTMARAVSGPGGKDTIHYMHSMNWVQ